MRNAIGSQSVDIYVGDSNDTTDVELIWPHYPNRYCFIYSNTVVKGVDSIVVSWIFGWIFNFLGQVSGENALQGTN